MNESQVIARYLSAYNAANGREATVEVVGRGWYRVNVNNWPTNSVRLAKLNEMADRLELRAPRTAKATA